MSIWRFCASDWKAIIRTLFLMLPPKFMPRVRLFVCLFWFARAIFQQSGDCHHCRRQGCKFRPMLSTYGFQQWGFFYVPHLLRHGTSVFKVISERPVILPSECRALGEGAITTYFKLLKFDAAGPSGARTLLSESTTTRLRHEFVIPCVIWMMTTTLLVVGDYRPR
jgi:hypothetical protein